MKCPFKAGDRVVPIEAQGHHLGIVKSVTANKYTYTINVIFNFNGQACQYRYDGPGKLLPDVPVSKLDAI